MTRMLGRHVPTDRDVFLGELDSFGALVSNPAGRGRYFTCLCVGDASDVAVDVLGTFCQNLLREGCVYFCAWGPGCERLHDIMDEEVIGGNPPESSFPSGIMTTSHEGEPLLNTVAFFLNDARPDPAFRSETCSALIISVGSPGMVSELIGYAMPQLVT